MVEGEKEREIKDIIDSTNIDINRKKLVVSIWKLDRLMRSMGPDISRAHDG